MDFVIIDCRPKSIKDADAQEKLEKLKKIEKLEKLI